MIAFFKTKLCLKYLILVAFVSFGYVAKSQDSINIITYNIEGMKPGTIPGLRIGFIIEKLKALDPDIIALQEINEDINGNGSDNQGQQIADALSEYFGTTFNYYQQNTHLSWDNQFREYIGIISRYPVEESGFHQLVQGVFPRKVVWNYIDTPLGKINFSCTHLSFNSQAVRIEQSQQIADYIQTIENDNLSTASILCGDFNDPASAPTITNLTDTTGGDFYFDSFKVANPNLSGNTVPSNSPSSRIDYVFFHNQSQIHIDTSYVIMKEPISGNIYCSDHLGVLSIFKAGTQSIENHSKANVPQNFIIGPIGPNPNHGQLVINLEMLGFAPLKISLLDIYGKETDLIFKGQKSKGQHRFFFNSSFQNNTIGFLKFESDRDFELRKIIFVQ